MLATFFFYVLGFIIGIGAISNIISIVVWRHGKRSKKASCGLYMCCLSLTDFFILTVLGSEFLMVHNGIDLRVLSEFCKLIMFGGAVLPQISALVTVAIAVERMLYVCCPVRMYQSRVKLRQYIVLGVITLFSFGLNSVIFYVYKINAYMYRQGNSTIIIKYCDSYGLDMTVIRSYWFIISYGIFTFFIPLCAITISNIVTVVVIRRGRNTVSSTRQRNVEKITLLVVCISSFHCISTLPYAYHLLVTDSVSHDIYSHGVAELILLSYFLNSGVNCVLYSLFGKDFRKDLKDLVCRTF